MIVASLPVADSDACMRRMRRMLVVGGVFLAVPKSHQPIGIFSDIHPSHKTRRKKHRKNKKRATQVIGEEAAQEEKEAVARDRRQEATARGS